MPSFTDKENTEQSPRQETQTTPIKAMQNNTGSIPTHPVTRAINEATQAATESVRSGVKGAVDQLFPRRSGGPYFSGTSMASGTPAEVDEVGRRVVAGLQDRVTPDLKRIQEQFNADVEGGLSVDESVRNIVWKFGADVARKFLAFLDRAKQGEAAASPPMVRQPIVPSYRGAIERMQ